MHREKMAPLSESEEENLPRTGIDTKLGKTSAKVGLDGRTVLMLDTAQCNDQLPPPLAKFKFGTHSMSFDCHQLYTVTVANAYA